MNFRSVIAAILTIITGVTGIGNNFEPGKSRGDAVATSESTIRRAAGRLPRLPLSFEAGGNLFISRGPAGTVTLSSRSADWNFHRATKKRPLRMTFVGANADPKIEGIEPLLNRTSYFYGNDPKKWRAGVATYGKVRYRELWQGIDLIYYGNQQDHEFDFVIASGTDPSVIRFRFDHEFELGPNGDLILKAGGGEIRLKKPVLYQEIDGVKRMIDGGFVVHRKRGTIEVGFRTGSYDRSHRLVIDPVITFASFLGSYYTDLAKAVKVDALGYMYVAGSTSSYYFPTTPEAFQNQFISTGGCSGPEPSFNVPCSSAFVTKITPSGDALVYSTYLGANYFSYGESIAVDGQGQVYIVGWTDARNFPVTPNAWHRTRSGAITGFLTKFNSTGTGLIYSTFIGGTNRDLVYDVEIDSTGHAYICGATNSADFPVTQGAAQTVFRGGELLNDYFGDAFVVKVKPDGSGPVWSTLLGGSGRDVAYSLTMDQNSNVVVAGMTGSRDFPVTPDAFQTAVENLKDYDTDAFATRIDPAGTAFAYSTLIGADGSEHAEVVKVNAAGEIYLFGATNSEFFPVTANAIQSNLSLLLTDHNAPKPDCFILRLNPATKTLVYSTYLGGHYEEQPHGMVIDDEGHAYLTGWAFSSDFPTTPGERSYGTDAFLTKVHPSGDYLVYSLTIGGTPGDGYSDHGFGITRDQAGRIYIAGATSSPTFPVVNPGQPYAGQTDAFILRAEDKPPAGADMTLRLTRTGAFKINRQVTYRIIAFNAGSEKSAGTITIRDTLPAGLSFVSAVAPDWNCGGSGQEVTCTTMKVFDPGASSLIELNVTIGEQAVPLVTNTVTLSYGNDIVTTNNEAVVHNEVEPVCSYALFPTSRTLTVLKSSGSEGFGVRAPAGCRWRVKPQVPWIHITSPGRDVGTGPGLNNVPATVYFDVDEYTGGEPRTGTLLIEDQVMTVTQVKQTVSLNAASYGGGKLAPGSIAALFGNGLATTTAVADSQPLPTSLGGTTVVYRQSNSFDFPARLFFVSPTQINYLVPTGLHPNDITVVVTSGDGSISGGSTNLSLPSPGLFSANADGQGVAAATALRVKPGNIQTYEPVAGYDDTLKRFVPIPIDLGPESEQVYLILFGTGIVNQVTNSSFPVTVKIDGTIADVAFVGKQGDFAGLDQLNVLLPRSLIGKGEVEIELSQSIGQAFPLIYSNKVRINIK
ncbi:MAG: SBBP repeat-containing protein [Acidobacteriota bacterium]|nr:MAG: SBBP repeat-containing protein [Acidobacteriota bacterium]